MRFRTLLACLVLALLFTSLTVVAQTEKKLPAAPPAYDFQGLMQKILDAWDTLDPANVAQFYAQERARVFYDFTPLKYTGWAEYAAGVKKILADYSSAKITLEQDTQAHQRGNTAWATSTWKAEFVKKDGTRENLEGRWTLIWEKHGDNWLIVHEHFSVPLAPPPAPAK